MIFSTKSIDFYLKDAKGEMCRKEMALCGESLQVSSIHKGYHLRTFKVNGTKKHTS